MIGFFGDSYIDATSVAIPSWPFMLRDTLGDGGKFYGRSGTSHWSAYEKFIKNYHKFDVIVFCHTEPVRWPHLPSSEEGNNFNIGYDWIPMSDFMKSINKVYPDIFTSKLLNFLSKSIYDSVNKICRENNIYLVNVFPFEPEYEYNDTEFPIFKGLDELSRKEFIVVDGKTELFVDFLSRNQMYDIRYCHLNPKNNIRVHNIMKDLINNKTKNVLTTIKDYEWDLRDLDFESSITNDIIKHQSYLRK